ncbi:MAG TPA: ATP-binding protein [Candidatus Dormibacteraeota bacterium]|jgi:two-component system phosphate regulon sensor histidine kinase PhoR
MSPDTGAQGPSALPVRLFEIVALRLEEGLVVVGADHRLRFANPAARVLLDLPDEVEGLRLEDSVRDYRIPLMLTSCLGGAGEVVRELDDPAASRHLVVRALPIGEAVAQPVEVAILLRDETRLRRLERVRRDFVANVSHELRTPVTAIQLLVETLLGGALDDTSVAGEFVSKIGLETAHMAQMVAELIELSTIESGRLPLRPVPTPVEDLVAAAERLRPLADERRQELRHQVEPGTPAVLGDPSRLGQVVRNLVHNAIKFTPEGGVITLSARGRHHRGRELVELRVADTGCGIAPEELGRVFERFYKTDRSRGRDGEGTGLGLAIARHTVEAHGGSIEVESSPGVGSVFIVRLPGAG